MKLYRFPSESYLDRFINYQLPEISVLLKEANFIKGLLYIDYFEEFCRGIDFYIFLKNNKKISVQITENKETMDYFINQGIQVIFLPNKKEINIIFLNEIIKIIKANK